MSPSDVASATTPMLRFPPIADLVPHAAPMLLLDRIVTRGTDSVTCALDVRKGEPFVDDEGLPAVIALEYMAQAAAVFAGLASVESHAPIRWGFLIGCSEFRLEFGRVALGAELHVQAQQVWGDSELGQFKGVVRMADGTLVATATMNVARAPEGSSIL